MSQLWILKDVTHIFLGDVPLQRASLKLNSLKIKSIKKTLIRANNELNECKMNNIELKNRVLKLELAIGKILFLLWMHSNGI